MTILYQGGEQEAVPGNTGVGTQTRQRDGAYSRMSIAGGFSAYATASTRDFWLRFTWTHESTILATNNSFCEVYNTAGAGRLRFRGVAQNVYALEYFNGSAYVSTGYQYSASWNYLQTVVVHADLDSGLLELWVDNNLVGSGTFDLSAIDNLVRAEFRKHTGNYYYSQIAMADESLLGWNIKSAPPATDGIDVQGQGTVADINEATLNDATYVTLESGQRRSTATAGMALSRTIRGVTVAARAMITDTTGPTQMRPYLVIGGTRYFGPAFTVTTGFAPYQYTWALNPATDAAWTPEIVNAGIESGWEVL